MAFLPGRKTAGDSGLNDRIILSVCRLLPDAVVLRLISTLQRPL